MCRCFLFYLWGAFPLEACAVWLRAYVGGATGRCWQVRTNWQVATVMGAHWTFVWLVGELEQPKQTDHMWQGSEVLAGQQCYVWPVPLRPQLSGYSERPDRFEAAVAHGFGLQGGAREAHGWFCGLDGLQERQWYWQVVLGPAGQLCSWERHGVFFKFVASFQCVFPCHW